MTPTRVRARHRQITPAERVYARLRAWAWLVVLLSVLAVLGALYVVWVIDAEHAARQYPGMGGAGILETGAPAA